LSARSHACLLLVVCALACAEHLRAAESQVSLRIAAGWAFPKERAWGDYYDRGASFGGSVGYAHSRRVESRLEFDHDRFSASRYGQGYSHPSESGAARAVGPGRSWFGGVATRLLLARNLKFSPYVTLGAGLTSVSYHLRAEETASVPTSVAPTGQIVRISELPFAGRRPALMAGAGYQLEVLRRLQLSLEWRFRHPFTKHERVGSFAVDSTSASSWRIAVTARP
jgi:opacity protein-like surface antigen